MEIPFEDQIAEILEHFPNTRIQDTTLEVPLFTQELITIKCKKYPKKPKIQLSSSIKKLISDVEIYVPLYRKWNKQNPPKLKDIIYYIQATIETLSGSSVHLSDKIVQDISYFAKGSYPNEMFCLLRCVNGILHEYIMSPGMAASETTAVFFPNRLGHDPAILATCHSHPSGNNHPSQADLLTFRKKPINIIIGSPYNASSIAVYNSRGEPIPFQINSVEFPVDESNALEDFSEEMLDDLD